jgi:hypothetical protein
MCTINPPHIFHLTPVTSRLICILVDRAFENDWLTHEHYNDYYYQIIKAFLFRRVQVKSTFLISFDKTVPKTSVRNHWYDIVCIATHFRRNRLSQFHPCNTLFMKNFLIDQAIQMGYLLNAADINKAGMYLDNYPHITKFLTYNNYFHSGINKEGMIKSVWVELMRI